MKIRSRALPAGNFYYCSGLRTWTSRTSDLYVSGIYVLSGYGPIIRNRSKVFYSRYLLSSITQYCFWFQTANIPVIHHAFSVFTQVSVTCSSHCQYFFFLVPNSQLIYLLYTKFVPCLHKSSVTCLSHCQYFFLGFKQLIYLLYTKFFPCLYKYPLLVHHAVNIFFWLNWNVWT